MVAEEFNLCVLCISDRVLLLQLLVVFRSIAFPVPSMPFWSACLRIIATIVAIGHDYLRHPEKMMMMGSKDARHLGQEEEEEDGYIRVR